MRSDHASISSRSALGGSLCSVLILIKRRTRELKKRYDQKVRRREIGRKEKIEKEIRYSQSARGRDRGKSRGNVEAKVDDGGGSKKYERG